MQGNEEWHHALQVLIDGIDIQALQLKWLRRHMGIVNQARSYCYPLPHTSMPAAKSAQRG